MRKMIKALLHDRRGVGGIEYALIASLISVAAIAAYEELGKQVDNKYQSIDRKL